MSIHYPSGVKPPVGEPAAKRVIHKKSKGAANRGMGFEKDINESNAYYLAHDLCLVTKRPTPINVVKVDYAHGARITAAYFETQSTTDYNGVYQGHYLDFEAKSTRSTTSFPLNNIAPQQVKHLYFVLKHGGIAFFLINWYVINETYLVDAKYICDFYTQKPRKSIPLEEIRAHGYLVKEGYSPRYDYLPLVIEHLLK
jgi:recombination protein U